MCLSKKRETKLEAIVPTGYVIAECFQNMKISSFFVPIGHGAVAYGQNGLNQTPVLLQAGKYKPDKIFGRNERLNGVYAYTLADLTFEIGFSDIKIGDKTYGFNGTVYFCLGDNKRIFRLIDALREKNLVTVEDIRSTYFKFLVEIGKVAFAQKYTGDNDSAIAEEIKTRLQQNQHLSQVGINIKDFVINRVQPDPKVTAKTPPKTKPEESPIPELLHKRCPKCQNLVPENKPQYCPVCGRKLY